MPVWRQYMACYHQNLVFISHCDEKGPLALPAVIFHQFWINISTHNESLLNLMKKMELEQSNLHLCWPPREVFNKCSEAERWLWFSECGKPVEKDCCYNVLIQERNRPSSWPCWSDWLLCLPPAKWQENSMKMKLNPQEQGRSHLGTPQTQDPSCPRCSTFLFSRWEFC